MVLPALGEQSLNQGEAKFRALAEASPAAICIAQDGRVTYANPMLSILTGRTPRDLIGMDPMDLVHPSQRGAAEARRDAWCRGEDVNAPFEVRIDTRQGDECWVEVTATQIVHEGGTAIVGTAIDITARKRLEHRMHQAQRLEAIGRLAGGVAHDFNNLLMVISGETERLLEQLPDGSPLRGSADAIGRAAGRAASLTQQLLAFGRRQVLIAGPVDVNAVVSEVGDTFGDGGLPVSVRSTPALPLVSADRARLEQALVNLLVNARDAIDIDGSVTITTDLVDADDAMRKGRPWLTAGAWVRVQVMDTGRGIAPNVLPHVFEPFFSTKEAGPGTGLGLSTVYGIVKQSGGFVWIDSEPGAGTRVTILLQPAQPVHATPPAPPRAVANVPRVLLVEDEDAVRMLLTAVLERNGFTVRNARSAEAALETLADEPFDVLLTDVMLPGMNGPELARHARRDAPDLRVLFMSGYAGDALSSIAELRDERAFIQKPFGSRALIARIHSLLAAH
jgi:two-component system cell cycle sensor histidine kinase/response regulator CckA